MAGFKTLSIFAVAALISLCVPGHTVPAPDTVSVDLDSSKSTDPFDKLEKYLDVALPGLKSETKSLINFGKKRLGSSVDLIEKAIQQGLISVNKAVALISELFQSALKQEKNSMGILLKTLDKLKKEGKIDENAAVKILDLAEEAGLQNKFGSQGQEAVKSILKSAVNKKIISEDDSNKIKEAYDKASTNVDESLENDLKSLLSKLDGNASTISKKLEELEQQVANSGTLVAVSNTDTNGDGKPDNLAVSVDA